jgi:copper transport protein
VALALLFGLLTTAGVASPAWAHAVFVSSSPEPDSLIQDAPTQVVLTFTEAVSAVTDRVRVIAPNGDRVDRNDPRPSGEQLIVPLETITTPGTYLVTYRVISSDSHPVFGAFSFSYKEVSPGGPPQATGVQSDGFVLAAMPVARWIGYLGLVLLVGSALVLTVLWPQRLPRTGPMRTAYLGAGLAALGTALELALQVPNVAGGLSEVTGADASEVFASQYGAAHLVRLGVLGAALVLLRAISKGRGWGADHVLLAVLGAIGIGTWSVSGHPSATDVPTVSVTADMVHLAAMSVWLGGLIMLVLFLLRQGNARELAAIVPVWSRWATYAIGALVLTGVAQGLLEVRPLSALFDTPYGLVLVAKVALVGVVVGVALLSRRLVPVIADDSVPAADSAAMARRLRRLVAAEAVVALVVIGITSVLVQLTPARTAAETAEAEQGGVQSVTLEDPRFTLAVDLTRSNLPKTYDLHMFALTPDLRPLNVAEWRVVASAPSQGIEGVEAAVATITPDHAIGQITLPADGSWTFTFTLRLDEFTNGIVTTTFTIRN